MKRRITYLLIFIFFSGCSQLAAQTTAVYNDSQVRFKQAQEYYLNDQYSLALPILRELKQEIQTATILNSGIQVQEIDFFLLACGLQQNDERAVYPSQEFITVVHNMPRTQQLSFHLANYYFRKQEFSDALEYYEKSNIASLNNNQISEQKFRMGYCLFLIKKYSQAKPLFNSIRQIPTDQYYLDANYYYGFIAYNDFEYNEALGCFEKVKNHPEYGKIVPFYLASIYYFRGEKNKAIKIAEEAIKRTNNLYDLEMKQLLGHAYFEKKDYKAALPLLEEYVNKSEKVTRQDIYELSFCYYQNNELPKAIEGFKQLSNSEDSLSQNAMYLLGDAYIKTNQKENARNAFAFCAANNSNQKQREVSLFNYAKLSYELGYQGISISEFKRFLNDYPQSIYTNEAKELLVGLFTSTSNYKDAIALMESLSESSEITKRLYPRMLYGRAAELINDGQLNQAEQLLDVILKDNYNAPVLPLTYFWKGEIAYKNDRLDEAIRYYDKFLQSGQIGMGESTTKEANYNMGYCYMRKENYNVAQGFFQKAVGRIALNSAPIDQDAYIRLADCYFMQKNYKQALTIYQQVLDYSWQNADYALFQKAMLAGVNNSRSKIDLLSTLQRLHPKSSLIIDANMEIAKTYMADEKFQAAIPYLNTIISSQQNTGFKQSALLQLGACYFNLNKKYEALEQYKKLIQQYPNCEEASFALENIRDIYIDMGKPNEYESFLSSTGKTISVSEADSLSYAAVEVKINNNDCTGAIEQINNYLNRFPNGAHAINAYYFRSECYTTRKDWKNALIGYEYVAKQGSSQYAEKSAFIAARTFYFELKDYAKAQPYYEILRNVSSTDDSKLEALRGLLRCHYQLKEYQQAAEIAKVLLLTKGAGNDDKALSNLVTGRNHQLNHTYDLAIQSYRAVVSLNKGEWSAEARYEIANCYFELNSLTNAEKAAFEVINKSGSYEFWVTKSYIILGDIYFKQKDYFNAKATFQSIVDNATNAQLKQEAKTKLELVIDEEKRNSKVDG